jgi:hypothetical protein
MNRVRNVRTGDPNQGGQGSQQAYDSEWDQQVVHRQWVLGDIKLYRSINSPVISESSTGKENLNVLLLREKNTIRSGGTSRPRK